MLSEPILARLLGLLGHRYQAAIGLSLHVSFTLELRSLGMGGGGGGGGGKLFKIFGEIFFIR